MRNRLRLSMVRIFSSNRFSCFASPSIPCRGSPHRSRPVSDTVSFDCVSARTDSLFSAEYASSMTGFSSTKSSSSVNSDVSSKNTSAGFSPSGVDACSASISVSDIGACSASTSLSGMDACSTSISLSGMDACPAGFSLFSMDACSASTSLSGMDACSASVSLSGMDACPAGFCLPSWQIFRGAALRFFIFVISSFFTRFHTGFCVKSCCLGRSEAYFASSITL